MTVFNRLSYDSRPHILQVRVHVESMEDFSDGSLDGWTGCTSSPQHRERRRRRQFLPRKPA